MKKTEFKFAFKPFSLKQKKVLTWWCETSPVKDKDGIICDGAVRSGKTLSVAISFVNWAMANFNSQIFGFCGKTIPAFKRNVWIWLNIVLLVLGYKIEEKRAENLIIISKNGKTNYFYIFSGNDESSVSSIQGITLAGVYFDEAPLMPESFVEMAVSRCSVEGSKFWFTCNPDNPEHWFKKNWIDNKNRNLLYFSFRLEDNLSLSKKIIERYKNMFFGVFYKRFILGLWVVAEGAIYDMFTDDNIYEHELKKSSYRRFIAIDYGTTNPMVFLEVFDDGKTYWVDNEYYYDSKEKGVQKTDEQYADDLDEFCNGDKPEYIVIDPSAASFRLVLKRRGFRVKEADNDVLNGIRNVATLFGLKLIMISKKCVHTISEHRSYVWKENGNGKEEPVKTKDHTCDALRYLVQTFFKIYRIMKAA